MKYLDLQNKYNVLLNKMSELREEISIKGYNNNSTSSHFKENYNSCNNKWKLKNVIENSNPIHSIDLSSKYDIIISGNWNGDLITYDIKNNRKINDKIIKHISGPIYMTRVIYYIYILFIFCYFI